MRSRKGMFLCVGVGIGCVCGKVIVVRLSVGGGTMYVRTRTPPRRRWSVGGKCRGRSEVPYRTDAFAEPRYIGGRLLGWPRFRRRRRRREGLARVALGALTVRAVVAAPPCVAIAPVVAVTRAVAGAGVRTHAIRHGAEQPEQQYRPHGEHQPCRWTYKISFGDSSSPFTSWNRLGLLSDSQTNRDGAK